MENGLSGEEFKQEELDEMKVKENPVESLHRSNPEAVFQFVSNPCFTLLVNDLKEVKAQKQLDILHADAPYVYRMQGELRELEETLTSLNYFAHLINKA